jgi:pSer/pThr/pTyr-binding forkhead associated (FHA) protein
VPDVYCNSCGHRNELGANFCSSCGAVLETAGADNTTITFHPTVPSDPVETADDPQASPGEAAQDGGEEAVLVVTRGPYAGSRFALSPGLTTAGRHPDSTIFLDDVTVSRRHAEIRSTPEGFVVRDVGSLNGTYLNRERIEESPLANGDELQIGKFKLVFVAATAGDDT